MNKYILNDEGKLVFEGDISLPIEKKEYGFVVDHDFEGICEFCMETTEDHFWYYGPWGAGYHCETCLDEHELEAKSILHGTY